MGFLNKWYNDIMDKQIWDITTVVIPSDKTETKYLSHSDFPNIHIEKIITPKEETENKKVYVVCGEFPNLNIDKKEIVSEDEFNYCLKESLTNNIGICEKSKCFNDFESAVNEVIKQLQAEYVKKILPTKKK